MLYVQYFIYVIYICKYIMYPPLQVSKVLPIIEAASRGALGQNVKWGGWSWILSLCSPLPSPEQMRSSGCGSYLSPSSLLILQPTHLSPLPAYHLQVYATCSSAVQFLLCVSRHRGPLLPAPLCYLLIPEGRFLNCWSKMEILCCPLQLLGWASVWLRTSWLPVLLIAYRTPTTSTWEGQGCLPPSKRALACIRLLGEENGGAWTAFLQASNCRTARWGSAPNLPHPSRSCTASAQNRIRWSLINLNKEGTLTGGGGAHSR